MSESKRVSFNQETAKSTEKHNDRSMYEHGYENRDKNVHWDMYNLGSSFEAEARFYEETFSKVLELQNERSIKMRKYQRVMDMPEWHEKHMPKECIIQLGNVGNNDDVKDYAIEAAKLMKAKIEFYGGIVISFDVHDDEETESINKPIIIHGTSHLHMRYIFLVEDENSLPKIDMKNCLLQHGVEPPNPEKKIDRYNNPAQTFLDECREMLEDFADEYEAQRGNPKVERIHEKRKHESVRVYKAKQRVKDAEKRIEELEKKSSDATAEKNKAIAERDAARAERDNWERSRQLIAGESFKRNGKPMLGVEGLEKKRDELKKEIDELEKSRDAKRKKLDAREQELDKRETAINASQQAINESQTAIQQQRRELDKREEELNKRESRLKQLWRRIEARFKAWNTSRERQEAQMKQAVERAAIDAVVPIVKTSDVQIKGQLDKRQELLEWLGAAEEAPKREDYGIDL